MIEHVSILAALEAGDSGAAASAMRNHASEAETLLMTRGEHVLRPPEPVA
jgi:DNA-binding GntR family transcriptional regulator